MEAKSAHSLRKSNSHLERKTCAGSMLEAKGSMLEAKSVHNLRKKESHAPSAWKHSSYQAPPFSGTPVLSIVKYKAQPPSRTAVCTCDLLTPHSASRSGYPRDDLESQVGRLKHLAALGPITRFARDAATFPLGTLDATARSRHR